MKHKLSIDLEGRMHFRKGILLAAVAMLAVALTAVGASAGSKGNQYGKLAAKACAKERKAVGNEAFNELYGKPAMPNCIGVVKKAAKAESKGASKDCKAEREELGPEAFAEKYGSNKNKKNAFGKCVSQKTAQELSEETTERVNAAKACKAEREDPAFAESHEGKTFDEFYGSNKNGKNAFGKCVSAKAQAQNDDEEPLPQV
jgi:hypothetical protein